MSTIYDHFRVESPLADTKAIKLADVVPLGDHEHDPALYDGNFVFSYQVVRAFLAAVRLRKNLWIWGPAGTGKTELCAQVAHRLKRPYSIISFSEESSTRDLIGSWSLANGQTSWSYGALALAIQRPGTLVVLDEANMAPSGVMAGLNSLLQRRELVIPETGETIRAANDVLFIATANTSGGADEAGLYAGSQIMNGATRSRFAGLKLDYLPADQEVEIIRRKFLGFDEAFQQDRPASEAMIELARQIRSIADEGRVSLPFSVRQLLSWAEASLELGSIAAGFKFAYGDLLSPSESEPVAEAFFKVFGIHY